MSRPVLIVFTRVPRLGVGKRRLAAQLGDRAALRLSRAILASMLRRLRPLRGIDRVIAATPARARLTTPGFTRIDQTEIGQARIGQVRIGQVGGDLGARMAHAFARYRHRPVILIGSDIPAITAADIRTTARLLRGHDAVFGPAADGGYWLIGLAGKRPHRPFAAVRWSSPHALADTMRNVSHRRIAIIRTLHDLDEPTV